MATKKGTKVEYSEPSGYFTSGMLKEFHKKKKKTTSTKKSGKKK